MGFELPDGKIARNIQDQVKFLTEKLKELYEAVNEIGIRIVVVEELPEEGAPATIYLVPAEDPETGNYYNEYLYYDGEWELIGTTQVDLSGYVDLTSAQTITGKKTFDDGLLITAETANGHYDVVSRNGYYLTFDYYNSSNQREGTPLNVIYGSRIDTYDIRPTVDNTYNLGASGTAWKDLYLSGTVNFKNSSVAKYWRIEPDAAQNLIIAYSNNGTSWSNAAFWNANGEFNILSHSFYLNGSINFGNNAIINKDSSNRINLLNNNQVKIKVGANETYFANHVEPDSNNTYDLGRSGVRWRHLYLSGSLRDGNNADYGLVLPNTTGWAADRTIATVDQLGSPGLYIHTITITGAYSGGSSDTFSVQMVSAVSDAVGSGGPDPIQLSDVAARRVRVSGTSTSNESILDLLYDSVNEIYVLVFFNTTTNLTYRRALTVNTITDTVASL